MTPVVGVYVPPEQRLADAERRLAEAKMASIRARTAWKLARAEKRLALKAEAELAGKRPSAADLDAELEVAQARPPLLEALQAHLSALAEKDLSRLEVEKLTREYWDAKDNR